MDKIKGFLRKVRPCLFLIFCSLTVSCTALKPGSSENAAPQNYVLTVIFQDQGSQEELMCRLSDMGLHPQMVYTESIIWVGRPEIIMLKVTIRDEGQLKRLGADLAATGVQIQSLIRVNN